MRNFEKLELLTECIDAESVIPEHIARWLKSALHEWQAGKDLHTAFNIHDSVCERLIRRNALLHEYQALHPSLSTWQVSKQIAEQVNQNRLSPLLNQANAIYPLPRTPRQIFNILKLNRI